MDTSNERVDMCKKAVEIQKDKPISPCLGDFVYGDDFSEAMIITGLDEHYTDGTWKVQMDDDHYYADTRDLIFLFQQDQLQKMLVPTHIVTIPVMIAKFYRWFADECFCKQPHLFTMEEFWLAFVMKELYNKVWNGKDWEITT